MRYFSGLFLIFLAIVVFACSEEDTDTKGPVITLVSPNPDEIQYGIIHVTATAADNSAISKFDVYVDQSSPVNSVAASQMDFTLDVRNLGTGVHTLRFVARDAAGNSSEASFTMKTQSELVSYQLSPAFVPPGIDHYVIISDEKGKVWGYTHLLHKGQYYTLVAPETGFTGQSVTITELTYDVSNPDWPVCAVKTYPNVPFGYYVKKYTSPAVQAPTKGKGRLMIGDVPDVDPWDFVRKMHLAAPVNKLRINTVLSGTDTGYGFDWTMYDDKTAAMFVLFDENSLSFSYGEVAPGQTYTRSINDLVPANTRSITIPGDGRVTSRIFGINAYGDFDYDYQRQLQRTGETVQVFAPQGIFTSFGIVLQADNSDASHTYFMRNADVPSVMKTIAGTLQYTRQGNTVDITRVPQADVAALVTQYARMDAPRFVFNWSVIVPPRASSYTLPVLPEELSVLYTIPVSFTDAANQYGVTTVLQEFNGINSWEDYMKGLFAPGVVMPESSEYYYKRVFVEGSTQGRESSVGTKRGREELGSVNQKIYEVL